MNNLSVRWLQGLLLLFLDKRDAFANKNEEFYNLSIKKILVTINDMPHQLFAAGLQAMEIYPELKNIAVVFDRIFNVFSSIKTTHLLYRFFNHQIKKETASIPMT